MLIVYSDSTDATAPDCIPEVPHPDKITQAISVMDETTSGVRSTAGAMVMLLHVAKSPASDFGPLKSIAEGLSIILGNCKV